MITGREARLCAGHFQEIGYVSGLVGQAKIRATAADIEGHNTRQQHNNQYRYQQFDKAESARISAHSSD